MNSIKVMILVIMSSTFIFAQDSTSENKYVKLIVENVSTSSDAISIDSFMRQQPDIVMSRMDYRTSLYFCTYKTAYNLSVDIIKIMLFNLGYPSQCSVTGYHGNGERQKPLNKIICKEVISTQENKL